MKYIIEIEDEPFGRNDDPVIPHGMDELYRAKGFNALVFDQFGLDKLTPLDRELDDAYQKGLEEGKKQAKVQAHLDVCHDIERVAHGNYQKGLADAWEAARNIVMPKTDADCPYFTVDELGKIFGCSTSQSVFYTYSASEALEKIKAYEDRQKAADEIKVGDIITDGKINYLVIDITDKSYIALQGTDFEPSYIGKDYIKSYHNLHDPKDMTKVAEGINRAVKGKQRDCSTCWYDDGNGVPQCTGCYSSKGYNKWEPKEVTPNDTHRRTD